MCRNSTFAFLNKETGETFRANCNAWKCKECGNKKRAMVARAIENEVKDWSRIRFWRFSVNHNIATIEIHRKVLVGAWNILCKEMKRSKFLGEKQRNFQYVRVIEKCGDGYFHQHCLVDEYLHRDLIQQLWVNAVRLQCKKEGINVSDKGDKWLATAWVNAEIHFTPELAANYITKYITKTFEQALTNPKQKRYTKSRAIIFFRRKVTDGVWSLVRMYDADFACLPLEPLPAATFLGGCTITHNSDPPNDVLLGFEASVEENYRPIHRELSEAIEYARQNEGMKLFEVEKTSYNHLCD